MIRTVLLVLVMAVPAGSAEMTMFIKNDYPGGVAIELFGQDTGTRWPGRDKVYFIEGAQRKSVPISCEEGERICYGAWVNGNDRIFWGVGPDNDVSCERCCVTCVEKTTETILLE